MTPADDRLQRPWTVVALAAWSAVAFVCALLFSDGWQISDLLSLAVSVMFIKAYWTGQRWAFHLAFAGALMCAIFLLLSVVVAPEQTSLTDKVLSSAALVGTIYLLRHPATKRFIRLDESQGPRPSSGPPDRGGRVAQAIAISVFGILAVGLPLLWAFGDLGGVLLLAGVVICVGSGLSVLFLGMPDRSRDGSVAR